MHFKYPITNIDKVHKNLVKQVNEWNEIEYDSKNIEVIDFVYDNFDEEIKVEFVYAGWKNRLRKDIEYTDVLDFWKGDCLVGYCKFTDASFDESKKLVEAEKIHIRDVMENIEKVFKTNELNQLLKTVYFQLPILASDFPVSIDRFH